MARPKRQAECHPDRPHEAGGMCKQCYHASYTPPKKYERSIRSYEQRATNMRKFKYGITQHQFEQMLIDQNLECAIDGCHEVATHVDHDHKTGQVRGILCPQCNSGLGMFKDSPEKLMGAVEYLIKKR